MHRRRWPCLKRRGESWGMRGSRAAAVAALLLALPGCTPSVSPAATPSAVPASPSPSGSPILVSPTAATTAEKPKVPFMILVLENHGYGDVIGNSAAPHLNALAHDYGLATRSYACCHPSLPNYLDLVAGTSFGISSD